MPFNIFSPPGNAYLWFFIEELLLCIALKENWKLYDLPAFCLFVLITEL